MTYIILTKIDTRSYREDEGDAPKTVPVVIAADSIRCFNPRRQGDGTRITFKDGGGYAVTEIVPTILTLIGASHLIEAYDEVLANSLLPQKLTVIEGGGQPN